jgi:hypothetical protein
MALWRCESCGAAFAVGLDACPQCQAPAAAEEAGMAKITTGGGASHADTTAPGGLKPDAETAPDPEPTPAAAPAPKAARAGGPVPAPPREQE